VRQVPGFVHGHGANSALEVTSVEEVRTPTGMYASLYALGDIGVAPLILRLVEFARLQRTTQQETKQLSRHDHLIAASIHGANDFDVLLDHMIGRNKHISS
jgi:hypothetical protein